MSNNKKALDWAALGQFLGMIVSLFTLVRDTFVTKGVGLEAIGWLIGSGKETFIKALEGLVDAYLAAHKVSAPDTRLWRHVSDTAIEVNLDHPLHLPFDGARVEWPSSQTGWVQVERKVDELYVGGRKVVPHLEAGQETDMVLGHDLRKALTGKSHVHPNVLDALCENTHLWPASLKQDNQGRIRYLFSWDVGFRASDGRLCVPYVYWYGGSPLRRGRWLGRDFHSQNPALVLAS